MLAIKLLFHPHGNWPLMPGCKVKVLLNSTVALRQRAFKRKEMLLPFWNKVHGK